MQVLVGIALAATAIPLLVRIVRRRMLWSLRNKLVVTYLLIGLAPVVLFVTLVLISGYVAAGQFAIHLADSRMQEELTQMSSENCRIASMLTALHGSCRENQRYRRAAQGGVEVSGGLDTFHATQAAPREHGLPQWSSDGAWERFVARRRSGCLRGPRRLKGGQFSGLVLDGGDLYLTVINQQRIERRASAESGDKPYRRQPGDGHDRSRPWAGAVPAETTERERGR